MIPLSLPAPIGLQTRRFTYLALAICILGAAHIATRVTYWSKIWHDNAAVIPGDGPVSLTVGAARFRVPSDYLVSAHRQLPEKNNRFDILRLAMSWPGLAGHGGAPRANAGPSRLSGTIQVELEHNPGRESLRARMDPFYRRLARGGELAGPDGLKILNLSSRGASRTELIVYDPSVQNGFIARCLKQPSNEDDTICNRAILLSSGLELRYRFARDLLPDWRQLDNAILRKIDSFRVR
ncbi:hypothetical protein [Roseibium marinum]|uniref:Uncharacterized protein n=1 Tax=Roseibium marinum TaxID=281252 RepID=A0A2S3UW04_9HYPH|nr:hypothetical protein [Roseibium marinum]POF31639.1 hypothetical protein CLV41_104208 [Roseibium marinum]